MSRQARTWSLQEAKAKFSEVVRRAQLEGPQRVTLHGKHVVTIFPAHLEDAEGQRTTGRAFVEAMRACPHLDEYPLVVPGEVMPVSDPLKF